MKEVAPHVDIALPTFNDESALFGDTSPRLTAERWRAHGIDEVAVKLGADGCMIFQAGQDCIVPAQEAAAIDTTGAGDSFNAAYLAARLKGSNPGEAALAGHSLAWEVVQQPGAIIARS
jgi:2-dehydro-3-deoxygluconokinase